MEVIISTCFRIMLFQIEIKQNITKTQKQVKFQNYVILDRNKTLKNGSNNKYVFQNYVILDRNKTKYN